MATTRDMNGVASATREIVEAQAEVQRDSYEALANNLAALQQRSVSFARGGLQLAELQESNARAAQEWWANGVKLLQLQQRNVRFAQDWLTGGVEALRDQAEHNRRTAEVFARSAQKQQEGFQRLAGEWAGAYQDLFFAPFTYAREGLKVAEQATEQGLRVTEQVTQAGLRLAEEVTGQTEQAIQQAERATRQAELRAAVRSALKTEDYDGLTVDEVSRKLDGLSAGEIEKIREYEKQNKNRETLVEQMDRKIRVIS